MPIPKGTRDFGPFETTLRKYIFNTITSVFETFCFLPIETPAMENIETLNGKYGEEGDQLIFKILNNGDYLRNVKSEDLISKNTTAITREIIDKALRYDLTIPFARFVAENRNEISFPFRRYQIQNVWRADRPQKGRYREFTQCDADIIGTNSLVSEIELIQIFDKVFSLLKLNVIIKVNNRKILSGLSHSINRPEKFVDLTIAIDKLDKIGQEGVNKELANRGFSAIEISKVNKFLAVKSGGLKRLSEENSDLLTVDEFVIGKQELETIFDAVETIGLSSYVKLEFDPTLARGLNYYTGAIFEVKANQGTLTNSICGGGRYDNLTGVFGLPNISGVGISFGADRIYDVMEEAKLFPENLNAPSLAIIVNFGGLGSVEFMKSFQLLSSLRKEGISVEIYPDAAKIKKQFEYADKRKIPFVLIMGENEIAENLVTVKSLANGSQRKIALKNLVNFLKSA